MICKPSEKTPDDSLLLGQLATECGLPDGILQLVPYMAEITWLITFVNSTGKLAWQMCQSQFCCQNACRMDQLKWTTVVKKLRQQIKGDLAQERELANTEPSTSSEDSDPGG
jgi:hypothetical protein